METMEGARAKLRALNPISPVMRQPSNVFLSQGKANEPETLFIQPKIEVTSMFVFWTVHPSKRLGNMYVLAPPLSIPVNIRVIYCKRYTSIYTSGRHEPAIPNMAESATIPPRSDSETHWSRQ